MKISADMITMRVPDNWHAHFRQGKLLEFLVPVFIRYGWRGRVIAEPNAQPPNLTGEQAMTYGDVIRTVAGSCRNRQSFEPVVTIQITEYTTAETVRAAYAAGVRVCKVYPRYVTTHSENGVVEYLNIYPALGAAQELGMIVQFHAEHPSYKVIGRRKEAAFIMILDGIRLAFPLLKISVEHVSSRAMVDWVKAQDQLVGASITIHHLYQTADDLAGYSKRSGGLCCVDDGAFKPGAKDPDDRDALIAAVLSGNPKFWYGGDDAAHPKRNKHSSRASCGAWNTMAALSLLISLFEHNDALDKLEAFLSEYGAKFYGFPLNEGEISLRRESWRMPAECPVPELDDSIVPFYANELMEWAIVD